MVLPLTAASILHPSQRICQAPTCAPGRHLVALDASRLNTYRAAHNLTGHNLKRKNPQSRRPEGSFVRFRAEENHSPTLSPYRSQIYRVCPSGHRSTCIAYSRIYRLRHTDRSSKSLT